MSIRRRFTLIWVSQYGCARELGGPAKWCSAVILMFLLSLVSWGLGSTYVASPFHYGKLAGMEQENQRLTARLHALHLLTGTFQVHLDELVKREQTFRIVAGLPHIHPDVRRAGIGGSIGPIEQDEGAGSIGALATATRDSLDRLQAVVSLVMVSLQEIKEKARRDQIYWRHIPTVRPLIGPTASPYGIREDPFTGLSRMHRGIDIVGRPDAPVKATADGIILRTAIDVKYGKYLDIYHGNGYLTRFAHLSSIAGKKYKSVQRGDIIGYVGKTGRATGYHVHYEVIRNGRLLNPTDYFFPEDRVID